MISWKPVGNYLGLNIQVAKYRTDGDPLSLGSLRDSELLLGFGEMVGDERLHSVLSASIEATPLTIAVFGMGAENAFDVLIDMLSNKNHLPLIMTKLINEGTLQENLESFFHATWPSGDRFDDWKGYSILLVDDCDHLDFHKTLSRLVD